MSILPAADRTLEQVYDLFARQSSEHAKQEVARAALLAAQYRAAQLAKKTNKTNAHLQQRGRR
jgi:hypothetical protein